MVLFWAKIPEKIHATSLTRPHRYLTFINKFCRNIALNIINNHWNIKISFYLETSGGQSFNLYSGVVYFYNTKLN